MLEHAQENACIRISVRFGARGHAMDVENVSTSMACPRAQKRTESLMLSQVRSACAGETSVMENRLNCYFTPTQNASFGCAVETPNCFIDKTDTWFGKSAKILLRRNLMKFFLSLFQQINPNIVQHCRPNDVARCSTKILNR